MRSHKRTNVKRRIKMRKFLYKHHKLTVAMIHILSIVLAVCGFITAIILSPGEELNAEGAAAMFGGLAFALIIEIGSNCVSPFKYGIILLRKLGKLSYGRSSFSTGVRKSTDSACAEISERLEEYKMELKISRGFDGFVGRWSRLQAIIAERKTSEYSKYSLNYYLYKVENLDTGAWQSIKNDLAVRLGEDRADQRDKKGRVGIVNCVCVLAEIVDSEVREEALKPISIKVSELLTLSGIRICVGEPQADRYYLCAERYSDETSRTNESLRMLARFTFGAGLGKLGKMGCGYTPEYLDALDKAYSTSLGEMAREAEEIRLKEKLSEESEQRERPTVGMAEGDIMRVGDRVNCALGGVSVISWIMLPEEAEKSFEEEDVGDIEDLLAEAEDEDASEEAQDEPTVPEEYRGPIVLTTTCYGARIKDGKFRWVRKKQRDEAFSLVREYLLREGFESVYFYNEKAKTIDPT